MLDAKSKKTILYVPGTSGLTDNARIQTLSHACEKAGFKFKVLLSWSDRNELQEKTVLQIQRDIDEAIQNVSEQGENPVFVIAKSFGAGMMLVKKRTEIARMVLWAPAIGIRENDEVPLKNEDAKLESIRSVFDIKTETKILHAITTPIRVIWGSNDRVVNEELQIKLIKNLPNSELICIEGMDHSPANESQLMQLVESTLQYLSQDY